MYTRACARHFYLPSLSALNYSSFWGLCVLVSVTLAGSSQSCVNAHAGACACCDLTLSVLSQVVIQVAHQQQPLSLSLFLIISSFFFHFPPSLCFSFGVKVCVSVCMWALSWTMRSALLCWSSWGAPIGGLWMEGLGYPLGFATCPAGTTQAPTSFTQVRR